MHKIRIKITFMKKDQINNYGSKTMLKNFNRGKKKKTKLAEFSSNTSGVASVQQDIELQI